MRASRSGTWARPEAWAATRSSHSPRRAWTTTASASKLGDASRELEALRAGENFDPDPAERRRRDCESFVKAFPEAADRLRRDKNAIPAEVWDEVRGGASLTDAYAAHLSRREAAAKDSELNKLRSELDRERRERENARRSAGSAVSAGGDPPYDPISAGWNSI